MRNPLTALAVVALLTAPGLGVINVKLTTDKTELANGASTTIYLWAQADSGLFSLAGNIKADPAAPALLVSVPGSLVFDPLFVCTAFPPALGTPGPNGSWSSFGSMEAKPFDPGFIIGATPNWALICKYTVTAAAGTGHVVLVFAGGEVKAFKPDENNESTVMGTITPLTITVVPEPLTLALLTLGTLLITRRRP